MVKFGRFLQLYTLHQIENSDFVQREVLHIRLSIVRYALQQLPSTLNENWRLDPQQGVDAARQFIVPRLARLLDDEPLQDQLLAQNWEPYHQLRAENAVPALPSARVLAPSNAKSVVSKRIDQAERFLRLTKTAFEVANAGLVLWKSWRAMRNERPVIIDAIGSTIQSQENALQQGKVSEFVHAYLDKHTKDPAHPVVFPDESSEA